MNFILFQQQRLNTPTKQDVTTNLQDLEFLAQKSTYFIEKQVESYKYKHTITTTILTIIVLFIPFFINGLDKLSLLIKALAITSLLLLIYCLINFIKILKIKTLDFGFNPKNMDELVNYNDYEKLLLYEIGANKSSFDSNMEIINKVNKKFYSTIKITLISILLSIFTLVNSNFYKMENDQDPQDSKPPRVIPTIQPGDRINLNDPFDMPSRIKSIKDTLDK